MDPIDDAAVEAARQRSSQSAEARAVINADGDNSHRRVTQVIDLVRQGGITRFAIQTEQPASETASPP